MRETPRSEESPEATKETMEKPAVLYRAFTVDPEKLTADFEKSDLVPGTRNKEDPTKIGDGNELGVYMSTDRTVCEDGYAHTSVGLHIDTPKFGYDRRIMKYITLPQCGMIVEVKTEGLPIRKPKLTAGFQENNGFVGKEWIADTVPTGHYRITRLILASMGNDPNRVVVDVEADKEKGLQEAIDKIRAEFQRRKEAAMQYKDFLEATDERTRMSELSLKRKWEEFQKEQQKKKK